MAAEIDTPWMARPQAPAGCPPGLEYLTPIKEIIVQQQTDIYEG